MDTCISCKKKKSAEELDPVTGLCLECMEWCVDEFPEFDDDFDKEAEI